jgi:hypothetical protein
MLTSLANNQWLAIDSEQHELLVINEDNPNTENMK